MVLKGVAKCGRNFLITINGVSLVASMLSIIVGLVIKFGGNLLGDVMDALQESLTTTMNTSGMKGLDVSKLDLTGFEDAAGIGLVAIGVVLFCVSVLGFFGSKAQNQTSLIIYAVAVGVIIVGELSFLIVIYFLRNKFDDSFKTPLKKLITEQYTGFNGSDVVSLSFNFFMVEMSCCGVDGFGDFYKAKQWSRYIPVSQNKSWPLLMPIACCKHEFRNKNNHACAMNPTSFNSNYMVGCYDSLWEEIHQYNSVTIVTSVTIGLFQIMLVVMACRVSHAIGVDNQRIKGSSAELHAATLNVQTISTPPVPDANNGNCQIGYKCTTIPTTLTPQALRPINPLNSLSIHPSCANVMNNCCKNSFNLPTCSSLCTPLHCQNLTYGPSLLTSQPNPLVDIHSYCCGLQGEHFAGLNGAQPVPICTPRRLSACSYSSDLTPYMFGTPNTKVLPRYKCRYEMAPPPYQSSQREIVVVPENLNDQRRRSSGSAAIVSQVLDMPHSIATQSHVQNHECSSRKVDHQMTNERLGTDIREEQNYTCKQRQKSNSDAIDPELLHQASVEDNKFCSLQQHNINKETARNSTKPPDQLTLSGSDHVSASTRIETSNDSLWDVRHSTSLVNESDIPLDKIDDVLKWMKEIPAQTDGTDSLHHNSNSEVDDPRPKNKVQSKMKLPDKKIPIRIARSYSGVQCSFRQSRRGLFNRRSLNEPLNVTKTADVVTRTKQRSFSAAGD